MKYSFSFILFQVGNKNIIKFKIVLKNQRSNGIKEYVKRGEFAHKNGSFLK